MTTTTTTQTRRTEEEEIQPLTQMEHIHLLLGQQYFWYFLDNVFIRSFDGMTFTHPTTNERLPFKFARLHREWALLAQSNPRLTLMAPRGHLKTTVLGQAYPLWLMCTAPEGSYYDGIYFSYKADLANERVADLKRYIKGNPFFRFWTDLKPNAESVIDFIVDWGDGPVCEVTLKGSGIMSATRGRHPKFVICLTPDTPVQVGGRIGRDPQFKRIDEIQVGDEVITHRMRKRRVLEVMRRMVTEEIVAITLPNKGAVRATGNHPFLTKRGWVRADELTVEDILLEANSRVGDGGKIVGEKNGRWAGGQVRVECQREGCDGYRYVTPAKQEEAKYCSKLCRARAALGKLNNNWKNGSSTVPYNYPPEFTDTLREQVRELYGRKCAMCGAIESEDKRLDVHHVDRNREHSSIENLIALCHPCHMKTNIRTDYDEEIRQLVGVHNGARIESIDREWYEGEVCNIEVEEDHTYALQGCVVHNCDDILSDFTNPLTSSDLRLINRIFRQTIMSLPSNHDDPLLLVGTPQAYDDILYQLAESEDWMWLLYPAIKDFVTQEVQWPEKYSFERLARLRSSSGVGRTAFEIEYQLVPVTVMDQFLTIEDVMGVVDAKMRMWNLTKPFPNDAKLAVYAGVDVGKKVHPSHVSVMLELPSGTLVMLYEGFLDHMSYPRQVRLLNVLAKTFGITRAYYDATFNVMEDRGLDRRWRGRAFTKKLKANLATGLEKRVFAEIDEPGIILTGNPRFLNQICQVRKNLQADETPEGHGDAFWSLALACQAAADGPTLVEIGSANPPRLEAPVLPRIGTQATRPGQGWQSQLSGARR